MTDLKAILEVIPQIILHGPPGTGKTYRAMQFVNSETELTILKSKKSVPVPVIATAKAMTAVPLHEYKHYTKKTEGFTAIYSIWRQFKQEWPIERLASMKLEEYAGLVNRRGDLPPAFYYLLERGDVKHLGRTHVRSQTSFAIFEYNKQPDSNKCFYDEKYAWVKSLGSDRDSAFAIVKEVIVKIATMAAKHELPSKILNDSDVHRVFGDKKSFFVSKIASLYQDENRPIMVHIFSQSALQFYLENFCNISLDEEYSSLQEKIIQQKPADMGIVEYTAQIWEFWAKYGGGISDTDESQSDAENYEDTNDDSTNYRIVQFHPSYNYEDFVRGIKAETKNNQIEYKEVNRVFAQICKQASEDTESKYYLIIDEINRANVAAVLGELLYALEYRGKSVETSYGDWENNNNKSLIVPPNLYIIGTMNSSDRSIGQIDYAVRRRFAFVECLPMKDSIIEYYKNNESWAETAGINFDRVAAVFKTTPDSNDSANAETLSPDYRWQDVQIGHSYFMAKTAEELRVKMQYQVAPLLKEYLRDGILLEQDSKVQTVINAIVQNG